MGSTVSYVRKCGRGLGMGCGDSDDCSAKEVFTSGRTGENAGRRR